MKPIGSRNWRNVAGVAFGVATGVAQAATMKVSISIKTRFIFFSFFLNHQAHEDHEGSIKFVFSQLPTAK
jgi:hypothetical protein